MIPPTPRPPRPRFVLCLWALALALCCAPALAAPAQAPTNAAPGWKAVLIAGDYAEPVFDNGIDTFAQWLSANVPLVELHRLSAGRAGRDPTVEPASKYHIVNRISALAAQPGQRCLVFITSHGNQGRGIWLAATEEYLTPADLARALAVGCGAVPTVVVASSCFSGSFALGPMRAPNRILLTAARPDRPSFGCRADRTYTVFDECLLGALPRVANWAAARGATLACVRDRERQMGVRPSEPQAFFGAALRDLPVR